MHIKTMMEKKEVRYKVLPFIAVNIVSVKKQAENLTQIIFDSGITVC